VQPEVRATTNTQDLQGGHVTEMVRLGSKHLQRHACCGV
jgi:hypothetical protein